MSLTQELIEEYLRARPVVKEGRRRIEDLTDREQAGMLLKVFGARALQHILEDELVRAGYRQRWPGVETLLEEALSEGQLLS